MNHNNSVCHFIVCFLLMFCFGIFEGLGQKSNKIQIVLVGTFHLTPSTSDMYKNVAIDLHSPKREREIQEVVSKLVAFNPNQICLEYPMQDQLKMDSIYKAYLAGDYKLRDNERDLFGFQAVKKLGLKSPTCINYSFGKFDADTVIRFAANNNQQGFMDELNKAGANFMKEADNNLVRLSLLNFLLYCNTDASLQNNLSMYTKYFTKIGKGSNYVGTDLVADWYSTNIHIYSNILRIVKPTDKRIVVIFGQGHIPILKHLFSNNPDFEVVDIRKVLN